MHVRALAVAALTFATAAVAQEPAAGPRPEGTSLGVAAGWAFPQSLLEPNTLGARVRLSTLTLEPNVRLGGLSGSRAQSSSTTLPGIPTAEAKTQDRNGGYDLLVGTNLRYPVLARGPVDLIALVGANLGLTRTTKDSDVTATDQVDRQTTSGFSAGLSWGLGLEWFFARNLSLSADVQNPLITYSSTTLSTHREQPVLNDKQISDTETTTTALDGAVTFRPTVRLQVCLYF
ncbi:MAG: outer membrane beta-barrel protein [Myxococcaceae bacterium]